MAANYPIQYGVAQKIRGCNGAKLRQIQSNSAQPGSAVRSPRPENNTPPVGGRAAYWEEKGYVMKCLLAGLNVAGRAGARCDPHHTGARFKRLIE